MENLMCHKAKKHCLGPQKCTRILGPTKLEKKIPRWGIIMIQWNMWVATNIHLHQSSPLRKQCVKNLHHMGKLLLNLDASEPLALMKKFSCFDKLIEVYVLLESTLHLGVYDPIHYILLNAVGVEFCRVQMVNRLRGG